MFFVYQDGAWILYLETNLAAADLWHIKNGGQEYSQSKTRDWQNTKLIAAASDNDCYCLTKPTGRGFLYKVIFLQLVVTMTTTPVLLKVAHETHWERVFILGRKS